MIKQRAELQCRAGAPRCGHGSLSHVSVQVERSQSVMSRGAPVSVSSRVGWTGMHQIHQTQIFKIVHCLQFGQSIISCFTNCNNAATFQQMNCFKQCLVTIIINKSPKI